jgi:hypothetical protein
MSAVLKYGLPRNAGPFAAGFAIGVKTTILAEDPVKGNMPPRDGG